MAIPRTFVFDLDGVLANTEHRLDLLNEGPDVFFRDMENDTPIEATRNLFTSLEQQYKKVVLTGRPERFRGQTSMWLRRNGIVYDTLLLRPDGSELTVMEYKLDAIKTLQGTGHFIMAVIEDNPLTAKYLREYSTAPVLLVSSGYYDADGFGHDPREDKRW